MKCNKVYKLKLIVDSLEAQFVSCVYVTIVIIAFTLLPGGFQVQAVNWHCSGDSLIVLGKEQLCLCYMDTDQEDK